MVASWPSSARAGTAEDLAVKAVRCAQLIKQLGGCAWSRSPPAMVACIISGRLAMPSIAWRFFHTLDLDGDPATWRAGAILVDETTAGLVASLLFVRSSAQRAVLLQGLSRQHDGPRLLLGKPAPYVGRQHELTLLAASVTESAEESIARVTLFIGEAGLGKTRLRSEFQSGNCAH